MMCEFAAMIGLDRGDRFIDWAEMSILDGSVLGRGLVGNRPEKLREWVVGLQERFGGAPIAIAVEQPAGALMEFLRGFGFITLFPLNPKAVAAYRSSFRPSGAKSDPIDAATVGRFLRDRIGELRAHRPDTVLTRKIATLTKHRRGFVDLRTASTNHLTAVLKGYYPQALELVGEELSAPLALAFLRKWPTLQSLKRARPETVRKFYHTHRCVRKNVVDKRLALIAESVPLSDDEALLATEPLLMLGLLDQIEAHQRCIAHIEAALFEAFGAHQDAFIFESLPGSGRIHCARLLAAFGTDRERFPRVGNMLCHCGIAPILFTTGNRQNPRTLRRKACPVFLKQSFHEWAGQTISSCDWAKAFYRLQREKGKSHHTAVRALAYKWIRIVHRMWIDRARYNEHAHLENLRRCGSPIVTKMRILAQEKNLQCA